MTNHQDRGRITLRPLDTDPQLTFMRNYPRHVLPLGWTLLAELTRNDIDSARKEDDGWLIKNNRTGRYAMWTTRGTVRTVDEGKVAAALPAIG